jgi:hypothetical protein
VREKDPGVTARDCEEFVFGRCASVADRASNSAAGACDLAIRDPDVARMFEMHESAPLVSRCGAPALRTVVVPSASEAR